MADPAGEPAAPALLGGSPGSLRLKAVARDLLHLGVDGRTEV
jgi:hypothetical protein